MNFKTKLVISISLLGMIALFVPDSADADTGYTYTSNFFPLGKCIGPNCVGPSPTLTITFNVPDGIPLDNLTLFGVGSDVTQDVTGYSFSDGEGVVLDLADSGNLSNFEIGTDNSGNITSWQIFVSSEIVPDGVTPIEGVFSTSEIFNYGTLTNPILAHDIITSQTQEQNGSFDPATTWGGASVGTWTMTDTGPGTGAGTGNGTGTPSVPEPSSLAMLSLGIFGLLGTRKRLQSLRVV